MSSYDDYKVQITAVLNGDRENVYVSNSFKVSASSKSEAEHKVKDRVLVEDRDITFKTEDGETLVIGEKLAANSAFILSSSRVEDGAVADEDDEGDSVEDED